MYETTIVVVATAILTIRIDIGGDDDDDDEEDDDDDDDDDDDNVYS